MVASTASAAALNFKRVESHYLNRFLKQSSEEGKIKEKVALDSRFLVVGYGLGFLGFGW